MPRTILIVDDEPINRRILGRILSDEYELLEAANGQEALTILFRSYKFVSAVLLDLDMPVMDGYAVLEQMQKNALLAQIPIIVTTGNSDESTELRALSLGANDYITKPYNQAVIRHRLHNTIKLRETAATVNSLQRDKLTGLYNRETFFEKAADMIRTHQPGYYVLACYDVNNFKLINDQYGSTKGDEVLKHLAATFQKGFDAMDGICSRITADNFAVLYPSHFMSSDALAKIRRNAMNYQGLPSPITFSIGRYLVTDLTLPVSAMYDRATLAGLSVKGRFDSQIAEYDESMRENILREQEIINEMNSALASGQFEPWIQPQYNHSSGALIGAEALVRWRHPQNGLIPPNEFIPVFERNGFIYEMDKNIWEQTCALLRRWVDEGRSPLPVSVNVSRYDMFRDDFFEVITSLVERYDIPLDLLRLEITESAFAKSPDQIIGVVRSLVDYGFTVEIDDFGSGYSSLNTLKDVPANVLKLDMRFLENDENSIRGGNILESIVRMAKWLGMPVIAEGVETKAQADYMKSIGCYYVQGYLYARPMPVSEYEQLVAGNRKERDMITLETIENMDNNTFWDPKSMDTLIFNSYVGGACIFEYHNDKIEIIRANDKYAQCIGGESCTLEYVLDMAWEDHMDAAAAEATTAAIRHAIESGDDATYEAAYFGLPGADTTYLRTTFRAIARTNDRYLLYATNENITLQREAERKEREASAQLQAIMNGINGGVTAVTFGADGALRFIFVNDQFYAQLGFTREQFEAEVPSVFELAHPDDRDTIIEKTLRANRTRESFSITYRTSKRDGSLAWMQCNISVTTVSGIDTPVQISVSNDITAQVEAEQKERRTAERLHAIMENVNSGIVASSIHDGKVDIVFSNNRYYELLGYTRQQYADTFGDNFGPVSPKDEAWVLPMVQEAMRTGEPVTLEYRAIRRDGKEIWVQQRIANAEFGDSGECIQLSVLCDITNEKQALSFQETLPVALKAMMASAKELSFVKDRELRYICGSRALAEMVGLADESELAGKTDYDLFDHELAEQYRSDDRKIMASGQSLVDYVERIPSADGVPHYSSTSKHLLYDAAGELIGLYGIARDITANREAFAQLKLLTNSIPGGLAMYEVTPERVRILYFSDGFYSLTGYSKEEYQAIAAEDTMALIFPEDIAVIHENVRAVLAGADSFEYTYRAHCKGGGYRWISLRGTVLDRRGDTVVVNAVKFDETERVETEETLRMSEELYRLALEHSGNIIARYDIADRSVNMTPHVAAIFAMPEKVTDVPYGPVRQGSIHPDSADAYIGFYEAIMRGDKSGEALLRGMTVDGWRWLQARFSTIYANTGEAVSAIIVFEDVTAALDETAAQKENELVLQLVAAHSDRIVFRYDVATKTAYTEKYDDGENHTLAVNTNVPETIIAHGVVLPESIEDYRRVFREIDGGSAGGNARLHMYDDSGTARWVDLKYSVIFAGDGSPKSAVLSFLDITESHEKELAYKRYLQTIGQKSAEGELIYFEGDLTANTTEKHGGLRLPLAVTDAAADRDVIIGYVVDHHVAAEEQEKCRSFFSREHLLTAFSDGERSLREEWTGLLTDGSVCYIRSELQMVQDPYTGHVKAYTILRNITEEKRAALEVKQKAERDGMTGLYNKVTTETLIRKRLTHGDGNPCALLIVDLDNLKTINDMLGHAIGDRAIRTIGETLQGQFRQNDVVGRVGGDEFAVFLDNCGTESWLHSTLLALMKKLSCVRLGDQGQLPLRASIGLALGAGGRESYDKLFAQADRALYHVKRNGKNDFAFYTPEMDEAAYQHKAHDESELWYTGLLSRTELDQLLTAVAAIYPLVISVNLTQNSYYMLQYEHYTTRSCVDSGVFDELIAEGSATFHPEDRQSFLDAFSRPALLAAHAKGTRMVSHEGRQLGDDGVYRLIHTDVIFVQSAESDDVMQIALGREVGSQSLPQS